MIAASSSSFLSSSFLILNPRFHLHADSPSPARLRSRQPRFYAACASAAAERPRPAHLSPPKSASPASLYEVLGIPMCASCQEIKAAYRRLVRVCHPDVVAVDRKDTSASEFMKINAAYSTLSDPQKRADYDRKLFRRKRPVGPTPVYSSMSGFSGYTRRNWETDQCW